MKKILFSLLLAFMSLVTFSQVQVGTGTSTTSNVPFVTNWGYNYSQQLYYKSEINASGNITSISLYYSSGTITNSDSLTVYLGHTNKTKFDSVSDWIPLAGLTQVYNGNVTFPATAGWFTITLDIPFAYNNIDNLVVAIDENRASYGASSSWRYTSSPNYRSIYYRNDGINPDPLSPPVATGRNFFANNIIFGGITQSCPSLSGIAAYGTTFNSTNLTWTAGLNDSVWMIQYGTSGFALGTGNISTVNNDTALISGLSATTAYSFYVRGICHVGDSSAWVGPFNLTTPCAPLVPPLQENFTAYLPSCWSEAAGRLGVLNTTFVSTTTSDWGNGDYLYSALNGKSAKVNNWGTSKDEWLISPSIDLGNGSTTYQIEFDVALTNYNASTVDSMGIDDTLALVISTDNGVTWNQANIIDLWTKDSVLTNLGTHVVYDLSAYTGLVKFGFYAASSVSNTDYDLYINKFRLRVPPTCDEPTAFTSYGVGIDTIALTWTTGPSDSVWLVEYGVSGYTPGNGTTIVSNNDSLVVTGLTGAKKYDFYLRGVCTLGDTGVYVGPLTRTTNCPAVILPAYNQDFASYVPQCWTEAKGILIDSTTFSSTSSTWTSDGFGNVGTSGAARVELYSTGNYEWLMSPAFDLGNGSTTYQLEFDAALTQWSGTGSGTIASGDTVALLVSEDGGVTWSDSNIMQVWDENTNLPTTGDRIKIRLTGYTDTVKFGFYAKKNVSGGDLNFYVDNFDLIVAPTCPEGDSLKTLAYGADSATITWQAGLFDSTWIVQYDTTGFAIGTGITVLASNDTTTITGLTPLTTYDFYLKSICHVGDSSTWIGPLTISTKADCPAPTAISDFLKARDSNNITWVGDLADSIYYIEWDTTGFGLGTGNMITQTNDTVSLTGLTPNKTYDFYVRTLCKSLDTSAWVKYTFTTLVSCPVVSSASYFGVTTDSINITWVAGPYDSTWLVEYGTAGFAQGLGTTVATNNDSLAVNGLIANTNYHFYIKSICSVGDTSVWFGPYAVKTLCAIYTPVYTEGFTTYIPTCWVEANGLLSTTPTLTYSNSDWDSDFFGNTGSNNSASVNLYSSSQSEWLISPTIDLGNGSTPYMLEFDIVLTDYLGTSMSNFDNDDRVVILISEDNGATWSDTNTLKTFNNTTPISNTGTHFLYDLSNDNYKGLVKFAIYAESKISVSDNDVFIDNFSINLRPSCLQPLSVSTFNIGEDSVNVTWSSALTDSSFVVEYGLAGFTPGTGMFINTTNDTTVITGLTSNTLYDVYVRTICNGNDTSATSSVISFNTECSLLVNLPFTETFDDTSSTQSCWTVLNNNNDGDAWDMDYTTNPYRGNQVAVIYTDGNSGNNDDYLIAPKVTLSGNQQVRFFTRSQSTGEPNNYEIVVSSTDKNPASFSTVVATDVISSTTYLEKTYDLSAFTGNYFIAVKIPNGGLDGWRLYIDDFTIENIPTCPKPTSLVAYGAGIDSINLNWIAGANDSIWSIEYGVKGFVKGTGSLLSSTTTNKTVSGLAADTEYEFYVRSICHVGDSSIWVGPAKDTTLPKCIKAQAFTVLTSTSNSINVGWNVDASHTSYIVQYGLKGFAVGTGTTLTTAYPNNFFSVTGLASSTEYDFYIKAVCISGDTSTWSGPFVGLTKCSTVTMPWTEGFENVTPVGTGLMPLCMIETGDWVTASGTSTSNRGPRTGNQYVHVNWSADDWIFTPKFDLDTNGVYEFSFWYNTDGATGWSGVTVHAGTDQVSTAMTDVIGGDLSPVHMTYKEMKGYFTPTTNGVYTFGIHVTSTFNPNYLSFDDFNVRDTNNVIGVDELNELSQFKVYPNPNDGQFTLFNEGNSLNTTVKVIDIQGRVVFSENVYFSHNARKQFNLSEINTGMYILQINNEGRTQQHRLVIE